MIQIYDKTNTDFSKNGNMPLMPTSCVLEAELNGAWVLTLEHPLDEMGRWRSIVEDAIIQCNTFMPSAQRFRIYEKRKSDKGIVAYARPIFLDTKDILLLDVRPKDKSGQDALDLILAGTRFTGRSDIADKATTYLVRKSISDALLGSDENSFLNRWGGEAIYDNETVIINERAGGDYGVSCEFGKNLKEIEETVNLDDVITRIIPVAYNGYTLEGDSPWVDSPNIGKYATVKMREVQFKNIALATDRDGGYSDLSALRTALAQAAADMFSVKKVDEPSVNYVVDMVNLSETMEYSNYAILETIGLGDTVICKHKKLNIDVSARVVRIVYDCIRGRNDEVELGNYQNDYFSRLQDLSGRIQQTITPSGVVKAEAIQGVINAMNVQLRAQKSIAQTQEVRAMLFEDLDPDSPTYGAMSIGTMGLQISSERTTDGRDWNWTTAMTAKGAIADIFIAGLLSDMTGRNYWNLDTGELRMTSSDLRIDDQTFEEHMKKATNLTVLLSNEYQSIPTDSDGNYTTFPECSTAIQVLYGQADITAQCTLTATTSAGVTGSLSGATYRVTALAADTGWVDIKATYLGTLTAVKRFNISKVRDGAQGEQGESGKDGASGRVYILEPSVTTIKRGQDGALIPDELSFSAYYRDGSSASRTAYSGRFKIERSTDGNSWETVYTSSANESSCRYELYTAIEDGNGNYIEDGSGNVIVAWYDEDTVMLRCTLYAAGGTTSALDMQTVPVVIDVAALTHEQIFNLVTDNGRIQGIVMINGQLYFNGTYIMSKSITADKLSVNDLHALAAKIGGWTINADNIASATNDTVLGSNGTIRVGSVNSWHVQLGADGVFEQYRNATNRVIGIGAKADEPGVNNVVLEAYTQIDGGLYVNEVEVVNTLYTGSSIDAGGLSVRGYKNREVETEHYGNRLLFSYETPSPMFGDIGNSVIDDTGISYIWLEDIFAETVDVDCDYQVFLQAYGEGSVYVAERTPYCFVVKGTPGLAFGWELKAMQKGYDSLRMEVKGSNQMEQDAVDYADEALNYMSSYYKELEEETV